MCGVVSRAVYPFYIVCKYSFYRILYAKALLLNVMQEYPLFTKFCYYMTQYVSVPVLVGFMISELVLLQPDILQISGRNVCVAHCTWSHASEHLLATLTTTSAMDMFINTITVILLALPVIGTDYLHYTATVSFVGAFLTATSTAVIMISRIYMASRAGYVLLRFSSDMLLMDWWFNFIVVLVTFHVITIVLRLKKLNKTIMVKNSCKRPSEGNTVHRSTHKSSHDKKASWGDPIKHSRRISAGVGNGMSRSALGSRIDNLSATVIQNPPKSRNNTHVNGAVTVAPRSNSTTGSPALALKHMNSGLYILDSRAEYDSQDSRKLLALNDDRARIMKA
ncbi:hypothetical protein AAMO2058_001146600 [Amorphochlora amoebiformis]